MDTFISLFERIPPTFLGIIIGSLFTIIGVVLTNASNTKRLRLQHEHERNLESKTRDLNLRRDVYLSAMEAISAGMVAVGRFADFEVAQQELMQTYTDRSPAISKVTIVGKDETIKAVANFNQELTGAFLRLGAKREKVNAMWRRTAVLEAGIEQAREQQGHLLSLIKEAEDGQSDEQQVEQWRQEHETERERIASLQAEQVNMDNEFAVTQMGLVQECIAEVATLDRLLVPVISLMRAELEMPFNEAFYTGVIESGHRKQKAYLDAFFREHAATMAEEMAAQSSVEPEGK